MAEAKIQFTPAQAAAIQARGGSLLVSAAAGSGKTRVLVERVAGLITDPDHPVDADSLLIMTFTNAAAAKLRADITKRLAAEIRQHPQDVRLRRQQMRLQRASIGTVDAFCLHFVQQNFSALDVPPDFTIADDATLVRLQQETLSTVLEQAVKEGLVPFNVASRADLPKAEKPEVNYFQPETVAAIRDALEKEPLKWKTLVHLFLITGARRGELLGLKWDKVDFDANRIFICNSILYSPDVGVYESTPKTERSKRFIALPAETMQLLRKYKAWQTEERLRLGEYYDNQNFVFTQGNGKPMHPDTVTDWLNKFSARHGLPHINPHAFRHTMASMLYFNGVDSVSISTPLGHAQVSTTANIYAHVMEAADQKSAEILSDIFLKKA